MTPKIIFGSFDVEELTTCPECGKKELAPVNGVYDFDRETSPYHTLVIRRCSDGHVWKTEIPWCS